MPTRVKEEWGAQEKLAYSNFTEWTVENMAEARQAMVDRCKKKTCYTYMHCLIKFI